jgi:hypothetical protein
LVIYLQQIHAESTKTPNSIDPQAVAVPRISQLLLFLGFRSSWIVIIPNIIIKDNIINQPAFNHHGPSRMNDIAMFMIKNTQIDDKLDYC